MSAAAKPDVPHEVSAQYARDPLAGLDDPAAEPSTDLLRHAVLLFGPPDGPARWATAAQLLAEQPGLPATNVWVAAAAADLGALGRHLAADPSAAGREGGPFGWPPLLYLTYARLGSGDPVGCAELLLDAGADPDAGFLWQGLPTPFTALTGVFGSATAEQPAHPDAGSLARLLLDRGADPNDGQALYNRMFVVDDSHLELLLAAGLGTGDGGPWRRLLPDLTDSPVQLLASQLGWAVVHGLVERIRLLAGYDVDLVGPVTGSWLPTSLGRTPLALARRSGRTEVAALLAELGVAEEVDAESRQLGRLLTGDLTELDRTDVDRLQQRYPSLVLRAAVADQLEGVRLLVGLGFDVNARGRQDLPLEQPWETALHHAAGEGKLELAALLLTLGADPAVRDHRYGATPLAWARELEQADLVALLELLGPSDRDRAAADA
ncbi:ankyrin repeat domain-containing protein [uncultured Friedmanniella sp.]|uniref:ankyrin repeat domain-containing protein n=1 Tax=uncultured Friedmanniella sp. TaxID=335381 RepID=UPI0035CC938A